jgi:hypothetical protein
MAIFSLQQSQPRAMDRGFLEHAGQHFAHKRGARIGIDDADLKLGGGDQTARGGVGRVGEITNDAFDHLAGFVAHAASPIDDPRHGHRRDARHESNVIHCGAAFGPVGLHHASLFPSLWCPILSPVRNSRQRQENSRQGMRIRADKHRTPSFTPLEVDIISKSTLHYSNK